MRALTVYERTVREGRTSPSWPPRPSGRHHRMSLKPALLTASSPRTRGWTVQPPSRRVGRALRAVFEDGPRAQQRSAIALALLALPLGLLVALRGGAAERPLPLAVSVLTGLCAIGWVVARRGISERGWGLLAVLSAFSLALGAAAMQHDRDLLLGLLVVPVAYFAVYMRTALVGVALLSHGLAAATPLVLMDTGAHALGAFGARLLGILITAVVIHGLAMALRESRGTGIRIAEALDD